MNIRTWNKKLVLGLLMLSPGAIIVIVGVMAGVLTDISRIITGFLALDLNTKITGLVGIICMLLTLGGFFLIWAWIVDEPEKDDETSGN